jgi:hypothetical protein
MRKYRFGISCWMAALSVIFVVGCGQETATVPSVVSTIPANGATSVSINTPIGATFNVAMKTSTITASTFTLTGPGGAVAGAVTYSGLTATFAPSAALAYATSYTGTITTGAKGAGGTPLMTNYVWTFTTVAPPPTVASSVPANATTGVPVGQVLGATFSMAMNPATINASTFTVIGPGGTAVAGAVTYSGVTATFTPAAALAYGALYTATITTGAQNLAGTSLAASYVWTFTTITPPPLVVSVVPANGATGVPISQVLSASFNEAMNCATLASPAATFTLSGPGLTAVAGTAGCAGSVATFTPSNSLAANTIYTATISTGAKSLADRKSVV